MEQLKTLEEISQPDSRNLNYVIVDPETGEHRRYSLQDAHAAIREIELAEEVPDDIRDHFQTARHLLLYSWFVYRFVSVAQMQAFASLEYALRVRLGYRDQQRPYLTQLLEEAVRQGAFRDDKFRDWPGHRIPELDPNGDWFAEKVIGLVRELRNSFAHGSSTLMPDGGFSLRIVADAINQLYAS